jgi:hypothetical protein
LPPQANAWIEKSFIALLRFLCKIFCKRRVRKKFGFGFGMNFGQQISAGIVDVRHTPKVHAKQSFSQGGRQLLPRSMQHWDMRPRYHSFDLKGY